MCVHTSLRLIAIGMLLTAGRATSLTERRIASGSVQSLDGIWQLIGPTGGRTLNGTVPGDLISDLERAGVIGDPYFELNFYPHNDPSSPPWDVGNWTYSRSFRLDPAVTGPQILLALDGVKMAADVYVNGERVGETTDQFIRYTFPVGHLLHAGSEGSVNEVRVAFSTSSDPRNDAARFMACSGGTAHVLCPFLSHVRWWPANELA